MAPFARLRRRLILSHLRRVEATAVSTRMRSGEWSRLRCRSCEILAAVCAGSPVDVGRTHHACPPVAADLADVGVDSQRRIVGQVLVVDPAEHDLGAGEVTSVLT